MCAKHRAFHPLSGERSESSRHHDSNPYVITDTTPAPNKFSLAGCARSDFQIFIMLPNTEFASPILAITLLRVCDHRRLGSRIQEATHPLNYLDLCGSA